MHPPHEIFYNTDISRKEIQILIGLFGTYVSSSSHCPDGDKCLVCREGVRDGKKSDKYIVYLVRRWEVVFKCHSVSEGLSWFGPWSRSRSTAAGESLLHQNDAQSCTHMRTHTHTRAPKSA